MSKATKIDELTIRDLEIINEILVGCSKLILSLDNSEKKLLSKSKFSQMDIARNSITTESLALQRAKIYRPFEFKDSLPTSVKNIHYSTMSDILGDLKRVNVLENPHNKLSNKSGRIGKNDKGKKPGVRSYYQKSRFVDEVTGVVNKKQARILLFKSLSDSGLLGKYLFHNHLLAIYEEKQNPQDKLDEMDLANLKRTTKREAQDIFEVASKIDNHDKLRKLASKMTNVVLEKLDENSPLLLNLYAIGRVHFPI